MASLGLLLAILFSGLVISPDHLPQFETCLFRRLFHLDCPGCGLTRAFLLIPRGEVFQALSLNWGALSLYLLFAMMFFRLVFFNFNSCPRIFEAPFWNFFVRWFSVFTAMLLAGHWVVKTGFYFLQNSIWEYLKAFSGNPFVF